MFRFFRQEPSALPKEVEERRFAIVVSGDDHRNDHRYYAGIAMKAMIEKWDGDPEKGRFVIAHKAHLIADAMVNADWERKEPCHG